MLNIKLKDIIILAIISFLAIIINWYREADPDLAIVYAINDPNLYPKDLLASFTAQGLWNVTFFFTILAFVSRYVDLWIFNFLGHIATAIFFFIGVFLLAKTIFKSDKIAYLAVILLMVDKPGLAGGATFFNYFVYRNIAIVLTLFSIIYFIRNKYLPSFILLGLSFDFHLRTAVPILGLFGFHLLFTRLRNLDAMERKKLLLSLFLFALIVLPLLLVNVDSSSSFFGQPDPQQFLVMKARAPHHYLPHTWLNQVIAFGPILLLFIIAGIYLIQRKDYQFNVNAHKIALNLLVVFLIYAIIQVIFTEVLPLELIMRLQPVRVTTFISIFGIIYIAYFAYTLYTATLEQNGSKLLDYPLISAIITSFFVYTDWNYELAWATIPLAIAKILPKTNKKARYLRYVLYLLSLSIAIYLLVAGITPISHFLLVPCWFTALIVTDLVIRLNIVSMAPRQSLLSLALIVFLLFESVGLIGLISLETGRPFPELLLTRVNVPHLTPMREYEDIQLWAKENTNASDTFLVPPFESRFRIYSKRPIYGEWLDGGYFLADKDLAYQWYARMNELGIYSEDDIDKYELLDESRLEALKRKYDISYAVFKKPKYLSFPVAYENERFVVYQMPEG